MKKMKKQLLFVVSIVLTATFYAQNIPSYVPTNGLVGWWPFNGNANDESGNGINGVNHGAVQTTDRKGKPNSAYIFFGSEWIECPYNPILNVGVGSFTLSCWASKNGGNTFQHFITKNEISELPNSTTSYALRYHGPGIGMYASGDANNSNGSIATDALNNLSTWNHFVGVYNAELGTISIYVNGTLSISSTNNPNPQNYNNNGGLFFGVEHPTVDLPSGPQFLEGKLDDIAIYNRALTQQEITALYTGTPVSQNLPSYLPTNGLVGWWPFNGNANDESGNGNHGVVNGATLTADRNNKLNEAYLLNGNSNISVDKAFFNNGWSEYTTNLWVNLSTINSSNTFLNTKPHCGLALGYSYLGNNKIYHYKGADPINNSVFCWSVFNQDLFNYNSNFVGQWMMITISKQNNNYTYYVNGKLDKTQLVNTNILDGFCSMTFGSVSDGTEFMTGKIDDYGIWNRALTQEEITALYLGEACTTPIATITPQSATSFCSGGSVNINAATNANYTYQWLNNGTPISAATTATYKATTSGKYSVIVKNNSGCIDTSSVVTVNVSATPSLPILTGPATLCYNSKAIFKASIAGGTWGVANDYLLISSPQGLFRNNKMPPSNLYKTGVTYTLKSKDKLCSITAQKSVWIRNVAATSVTLTASKQTLKVGEEVAATATTKITGNALFWMSASTSFVSVTGVSPYIALIKGLRPATGANIAFSVEDAAKGCRNTAFLPFTVTAAASLVDNESNTTTYTTDLNVYPNPSNGMVTIENIGEAKTISLIDVTGRVLKTTPVNADRMRLDYSTITKGNYFISIQGENLKEMKSIVIE